MQNLNHSVCLDPVQVIYPVGHRHRGPWHTVSNALLPVNNKHTIKWINFDINMTTVQNLQH
jgi:hypothetical protein